VLAAITLERAARLQFVARSIGDTVPIPQQTAGQLFGTKYTDEFTDEYWMAWLRMVRDAQPADLL
jgi:hypothetical protein